MKKIFILSIFLLSCITLKSQSIPENPNKTDDYGKRQGSWTILYNKEWEVISDKEKVEYYRIIKYDDDKPVGIVRDYYRSGQIQWEGQFLKDRPDEIMDGEITWFRKDGTREQSAIFSDGSLISQIEYEANGRTLWYNLNQFGIEAYNKANYPKATEWFEKALEQAKLEFGKDHPDYSTSLNNLAFLYNNQGLIH